MRLGTTLLSLGVFTIVAVGSGAGMQETVPSPTGVFTKLPKSTTIRQDINGGLIHANYTVPTVFFKNTEDVKATNLIEQAERGWISGYVQAVGAMCGLDDSLVAQHGRIYEIHLYPVTVFQRKSLYSLELESRYNFARGVYQVSYYTLTINLERNRQLTLTSLFQSRAVASSVLHQVQRSVMNKYGPPTQANPYGFNQIESYTGFHVVPNGLEFEYLSCTVAACGAGPITILIPLNKLPRIRTLSPQPPVVD